MTPDDFQYHTDDLELSGDPDAGDWSMLLGGFAVAGLVVLLQL